MQLSFLHSMFNSVDPRTVIGVKHFPRLVESTNLSVMNDSNTFGIPEPYGALHIEKSLPHPTGCTLGQSCHERIIPSLIVSHLYSLSGQVSQVRKNTSIRDDRGIEYYLRPPKNNSVTLLNIPEYELPAQRGLKAFKGEAIDLLKAILNKRHPQVHLTIENLDRIKEYLKSAGLNQVEVISKRIAYEQAPPFLSLWGEHSSVDTKRDIFPTLPYSDDLLQEVLTYFINALKKDSQALQYLKDLQYFLQTAFDYNRLTIEYGNTRDNMFDAIPSCINGIQGISREAAITFETDPNVEIIGMYPHLYEDKLRQIIKAITIEVTDAETKERKLLVEGVLADDNLERVSNLDWRPIILNGILRYALSKGIKKVVINSENSDSHESAAYFKRYIAENILDLQEGRDFSYPLTGKKHHLFVLDRRFGNREIDGFSYTHVLDKEPMPDHLVRELAADDRYHGEGYFDAWQPWNKHIVERAKHWELDLKNRFPYAELRVPEINPVWNAGQGPVFAMELDVEEVLDKFRINSEALLN